MAQKIRVNIIKECFCVFIGFLCSCGIELSQLITQRGYCQLDDVVTNTVGMLVGWGIWKMLSVRNTEKTACRMLQNM